MYTQRPFGWWSFSIQCTGTYRTRTGGGAISVKLSERRTLGTGTPLPLGQCRRRWSRAAPTGQRDGVAWRRRGQDTVDTLDETCTSTECRRERGGRGEGRGARSEDLGSTSPCGARRPGRSHRLELPSTPRRQPTEQFHRSLPDGQRTETIKHLVLKFNPGDVGRTV